MDIVCSKNDYKHCQAVTAAPLTLGEGESLLVVDHFSFTANNISYAATGDALGYWQFFPSEREGMGRIPVWGFATCVASRAPRACPVGSRIYGYFPMSTFLVVKPKGSGRGGFVDQTEHREGLPMAYNAYSFCRDCRSRPWRILVIVFLCARGLELTETLLVARVGLLSSPLLSSPLLHSLFSFLFFSFLFFSFPLITFFFSALPASSPME